MYINNNLTKKIAFTYMDKLNVTNYNLLLYIVSVCNCRTYE